MENKPKIKQLLKILIGAAWIDGIIRPEEREYLHQKARKNQLTDEPEIKMLLSEMRPIEAAECYQWLEEYLGESPKEEDYQHLIEEISALVYSDKRVATEEAKLLTQLQDFESTSQSKKPVFDKILKLIQNLYRHGIGQKVE